MHMLLGERKWPGYRVLFVVSFYIYLIVFLFKDLFSPFKGKIRLMKLPYEDTWSTIKMVDITFATFVISSLCN